MFVCPRRVEPPDEFGDDWSLRWIPGRVQPKSWRILRDDGGQTVDEILSTGIGWLESWPKPPKVCSYCGSARPDDVFRLVKAGWEACSSSKIYKFYVRPPGYRANAKSGEGDFPIAFQVPTPPVKCYTHHLSDHDVARLIRIINNP